jgi:hypothetical protein
MDELKRITKSLSSGVVAGVCAKTIVAPLDRAKIIFQGMVSVCMFASSSHPGSDQPSIHTLGWSTPVGFGGRAELL